ncbi:MAG TPA: ribonuclease III [Parachlamydiales bacterium]|nr:MAG: ribonuclease III [Chlamydiae bacterium GWF2_49_8]OGN57983.1 MAG: ribonuclease III [Chlamydiae bacterium RIFCSPHIGHO2_02_FULL_49_29]OGN63189.1 MAG: ribonuclease III [Chlamydiae bacterium RIFCSPHIGHO2_12_FULL_49_32]OGN67619.1 MAG: ribonuclease III [Chlamydiae bacterium RIFCSPLOWO2_02_FULL_49_12]OGN70930.1 MAG: ribonuclease III [Chlamydiae bacterium RIFCSPLOWO2_12_FULL_49_12]HAZ15753.1 ribonuclease III [Parachlamydiales bacterium]
MMSYHLLLSRLPEIEKKLNYSFNNKELLLSAFVHRSYYNEHRGELQEHNERLEFLGDAVLGLLISHYLFNHFPHEQEGQLSHMRSFLVDADSCSKLLQSLDLDAFILLGRGERRNKGRGRETILADLFEALIGALFLDGGVDVVRRFFFSHFEKSLLAFLIQPIRNWKAELQDYAQKKYQITPSYIVLSEKGPDHHKFFLVGAFIEKKSVGEGEGHSKKEAEIEAAKKAMERLEKGAEEWEK